jgi:hypothetical protein
MEIKRNASSALCPMSSTGNKVKQACITWYITSCAIKHMLSNTAGLPPLHTDASTAAHISTITYTHAGLCTYLWMTSVPSAPVPGPASAASGSCRTMTTRHPRASAASLPDHHLRLLHPQLVLALELMPLLRLLQTVLLVAGYRAHCTAITAVPDKVR